MSQTVDREVINAQAAEIKAKEAKVRELKAKIKELELENIAIHHLYQEIYAEV